MAPNPAPTLDRPWRRPGALRYALERIRGIAKPPITVIDPPTDIEADRDVSVPTRDGTVLRINVFREPGGEPRPVILSIHPYGKDNLPARRGKKWTYSLQYRILRQPLPVTFSALTGSSRSRTLTASKTALVIAAGSATLLISPIAVVENGAAPLPPGSRTVSSSGMSMVVGSL